jgi:crossover junction endodeoxyribonuclease RuvC
VIERRGGVFRPLVFGVFTTPSGMPAPDRLVLLRDALEGLLERWLPAEAAIEALFFAKNVTTALGVAEARGVLLCSLAARAIPIAEYTPNVVKQGVTGSGRADKAQVQEMVRRIFALDAVPRPDDAADALAVALCHAQSRGLAVALAASRPARMKKT